MKKKGIGTTFTVQWLRLYASTAVDAGLIPDQGPKILPDAWPPPKKKRKEKRKTMTQTNS